MTFYGEDYPEPYDPGPEENPTVPAESDPLRHLRDGPWLDALDMPPMRWAVPGLIPEGLTLLAGAPKMGKSWLALDLCLAVSSGGKALGVIPVEKGKVLYLALEDGARRLRERVQALNGEVATPPTFMFQTELEVGLPLYLEGYAERHPETRLIVVDTLGRVRPPGQRNGDRYAEDYRVMAWLQGFALRHRLAMVVIHHTRKAKAAEGYFVDEVSGTNGLTGAADVVAVLQRAQGQPDGTLRVTARDFEEADVHLCRTGPAWVMFDGIVVNPNVGDDMARVLAEVAEHAEGIGPRDVATATGLDYDVVKTYLSRAAERGDVHKASRGVYAPVTSVSLLPRPTPDK